MPPDITGVGEAMQKEHRGPLTGMLYMETQSVGGDSQQVRAYRANAQSRASQPTHCRLLYAGAASDNAALIRVLTKCGVRVVGEGRGFAHGATRKPTRSCSDSMHDPNCPRLDERAVARAQSG